VALSADGNTLAAGSPVHASGSGAVYLFTKPAGGWATTDLPAARLTYAAGAPGDWLGYAVALSADGSTLVASAPFAAAGGASRGAAYIYTRPPGGWATTDAPTATISYAAGADDNPLGSMVALSADGSTLVLRGNDAGGTGRGALYVYTRPAGGWATTDTPTATFTTTPGFDNDALGSAVALSAGGRTLVGGTAPNGVIYPKWRGIYIFRDRTTNADLSGLALSQGTLSPAFAIGTRAYTATVDYSVSSVTVTPTLADADATVTVNGIPVNSGSASGAISLRPGPNLITVVVTAEDPAIRTTTTITVTRPARVWLPVLVR
jgi:hypothetical protein